MDTTDMNPNPWRAFRAVASAFFGVRRQTDSERDLEHLSIGKIAFAAVILMALFVATILLIVRAVVG